jgi:hypothetical protein
LTSSGDRSITAAVVPPAIFKNLRRPMAPESVSGRAEWRINEVSPKPSSSADVEGAAGLPYDYRTHTAMPAFLFELQMVPLAPVELHQLEIGLDISC